jgi:di/tricarboxylate transporter
MTAGAAPSVVNGDPGEGDEQSASRVAERQAAPVVTPDQEAASSGRLLRLLALATIYLVVAHLIPPPTGVTPAGWRITGVFLATVAGLMLQPLPGAAMVVIGLTLFVIVGGLPMASALTGFSSPSVWLVLGAMLMSRVLSDTGLSRRIALFFVRAFGKSSLGVSYSLVLTSPWPRAFRRSPRARAASSCRLRAASPSSTTRGRALQPRASAGFSWSGSIKAARLPARCS